MPSEFTIPAALIDDKGRSPWPHFVGLMTQHAPESFDDIVAGRVTVAIRDMRAAGEPISLDAIYLKLPHLSDITKSELEDALNIEAAEYYAFEYWEKYQARRVKDIGEGMIAGVTAAPKQVGAIMANAQSALATLAGDSQANKFSIRTPDEILAMNFDDQDIILGDRMMAEGQATVIVAAGGAGKSRLLLQLAACVVTGRKFLNFQTGKANAKWLILQTENSNRRLHDDLMRIKAWLGEDWCKFAAQVKFHTVENDTDGMVNLDSPEAVANIQGTIKIHAPDIVVPDPLNHFAIGDLNKDSDMMATLQTLSRICRKGNPRRAILVLHHALTGKSGAARATGFDRASFGRNSKVLFAWTRAQINLAAVDAGNNERLIVACGKCSNGREFQPFGIRLNPETMIYECDPTVDVSQWEKDMTGAKDKAPQANPDRVRELCDIAGMTKATLSKAIMADCGCVRPQSYKLIDRAIAAKTITFNKMAEKCFRK